MGVTTKRHIREMSKPNKRQRTGPRLSMTRGGTSYKGEEGDKGKKEGEDEEGDNNGGDEEGDDDEGDDGEGDNEEGDREVEGVTGGRDGDSDEGDDKESESESESERERELESVGRGDLRSLHAARVEATQASDADRAADTKRVAAVQRVGEAAGELARANAVVATSTENLSRAGKAVEEANRRLNVNRNRGEPAHTGTTLESALLTAQRALRTATSALREAVRDFEGAGSDLREARNESQLATMVAAKTALAHARAVRRLAELSSAQVF